MAGEWKRVTLGEVYEFSSGLSKPRSEFGSGYPFLTFKEVFENFFVPANLTALVKSSSYEQERCSIRRGDVFLTRTSETQDELGMSCVSLKDYPSATFNGFTKRLRPKRANQVIPEYASYFFRSPLFRQAVTSMSTLSTRASLNNEMLGRLSMMLPPIEEQISIGSMLKSLDDKIELNRRMNETLEAMARAIFKSWFVDFDPVRAKAEGRTPNLPPDLAALFPDSFEDSELGEIPEGWRVGSVYEAADVVYGAPFSSKQFNSTGDGKPLVRIRDLRNEAPGVWTPESHPKGYLISPGDIVVGMDGEFRAYLWGGEESWMNQRICCFRPKAGWSAALIRENIIAPLAEVEATETATTVIHLGKSDIDRFQMVMPEASLRRQFGMIVQPLYDKIVSAKQESRTLVNLRDTLLPALISGELRLADAEKMVSATAGRTH